MYSLHHPYQLELVSVQVQVSSLVGDLEEVVVCLSRIHFDCLSPKDPTGLEGAIEVDAPVGRRSNRRLYVMVRPLGNFDVVLG